MHGSRGDGVDVTSVAKHKEMERRQKQGADDIARKERRIVTVLKAQVTRTAHFSPCRRYRYWLRIAWEEKLPFLVVCGLNPSTADEVQDDPTLRRVQGFARDMGHGGVLMLNAFAWRSTDPKGLLTCDDPVGPANTIENFKLWGAAREDLRPVAAWGVNLRARRPLRYRLAELGWLQWDCFRKTKHGDPEHPLYLPASCRPIPWNYKL